MIRRDRVTLVGAGADRTRIVSHLTAPAPGVIRVEGQQGHRVGYLAQPLGENGTVLHVDGRKAVGFEPGSLVWLKEPNDDAFLQRLGSEKWNRQYPYLRQALVQVAGTDADGAILL